MATEPLDIARVALLRRSAAGGSWLPVTGTSMGDGLPSGAEVRLVPGGRPKVGEVWAHLAPDGRILVHRCIGRWRGWRFCGDTRTSWDLGVDDDALIGRADAWRLDVATTRLRRRPVRAALLGTRAGWNRARRR